MRHRPAGRREQSDGVVRRRGQSLLLPVYTVILVSLDELVRRHRGKQGQIARPRAAEEGSRRRREGRGGPHRNRLPHHLPRRGRRVAGGTAPPEPRPPGGGKPEPSPERLRLRRGRLHGPQGQRSGKPGQPQQHRARGEPRRDPAPAAARPPRGHRRPDPALTRPRNATASGIRRNAARHPEPIIRGRKPGRHRRTSGHAATEPGQNIPIPPPFVSRPKDQPQRGKILRSSRRPLSNNPCVTARRC